ncbi:MAG: Rpn family recombination-promoting nuclease/putative transposase [Treponema sp.]|nr:Rpn family recombination-promoting nuclease/putative transposase [Treponema sp.]
MAKLLMDADILPPSDDWIFKVLLTHPEAKKVLIDVISTVIERNVVDVQVRNIEMPVMDTDEKQARFDVDCVIDTEDGEQLSDQINMVIIELSKLNEAFMEPVESLTSFEKWSLFLRYTQEPMYRN